LNKKSAQNKNRFETTASRKPLFHPKASKQTGETNLPKIFSPGSQNKSRVICINETEWHNTE